MTIYRVWNHFWGVLKGFRAIFVSCSHFCPYKWAKNANSLFLRFWALKLGFLGLKRYQKKRNIDPAAWRYQNMPKKPFLGHFWAF